MDDSLREEVRRRAGECCEYCAIAERYFTQRFQIEHIRPRSHRGESTLDNLALACERCNLHKGPSVSRTRVVSVDRRKHSVDLLVESRTQLKRDRRRSPGWVYSVETRPAAHRSNDTH